MQLKALHMLGFKSFADKTTVVFQPGVTAVVGPNGCGKSNISDSIRWVLGEQSARHLRGEKMEDVIFNGTENRKPLGMAEVSLTLKDVAGALSSEFGQYSEIEITRRLFRSGESEYFINKIPCRLKDIRDLMMDAGVGAKIHAIIEQDRVDQILSSKPEDRRFLFEEVAGVMKYKARRQESLSKLESTQQNQVRVNDILTEVKRQVNSLDRQARKAERYQNLRAELKDLEFRLAAVEYSNLGIEGAATTEEFTKIENELIELHASLGKSESAIEGTKAEALSAERELAALQHRIHETESALGRAEHRVEMSKSQIAAFTEQRGRDLADMEYLKKEIANAAERKAGLEQEARTIAASIEEKNSALREKTAAFEALSQELMEKERSLEQARAGVYSAITESAAEKTRRANLESRLTQIDEEDARGKRESEDIGRTLNECAALLADKEREISETAGRRSTMLLERGQITARLEETDERKKTLEATLGATKDKLSAQRSRLRSLLELEQSLEGYQKSVQAVMSARKEGGAPDRLGTIHGLVADIIETDPQYELAIEAVLGDRLQYVVVGSHADSLRAIDYLKSESGGRSTFLPSSPREIKSEPFVRNGHQGVIGPALGVVRYQDDHSNVAQYLLGDVVVVDTLQTALHLWDNNGFQKTLVTLAGEIVDPWGAVTGGQLQTNGTGMLTKRREIKDLEREVSVLEGRVAELDTEMKALEQAIESDKRTEAELAQAVHRTEIELVNREKDCGTVRDDIKRSEQRRVTLDAEASERADRRKDLSDGVEKSAGTLRDLEAGQSNAQTNIESLQRDLALQKESLETARAGITEIKMEVTALQEKQDAAARNLAAFAQSESDLAERLMKSEAELSDIAAKLDELGSIITAAEAEIAEHIKTLDEERRVLVSKQEAHSQKTEALRAFEDHARKARHEIEIVQKALSANEVKRTELRMKIEHLKDNIWATYHTELEAVVQE